MVTDPPSATFSGREGLQSLPGSGKEVVTMAERATAVIEPLGETPPLRHLIHQRLEQLIASGSLAPGMRLIETDLAARLGVSRGPIREAMQHLEADGFVDLRPRLGTFVHTPTLKEIEDFYDLRRALEVESSRLAAARLQPEGADQLRAALAERSTQLAAGDRGPVPRSEGLHQVISRIADNVVIGQMLSDLAIRIEWYRSPFQFSLQERAWEDHRDIVEAICAQDVEAAGRAMAAHIDRAYDKLISEIREHGHPAQA
jgi:DNA-binding GntR family transcriptional regulator